VSGGRVLVAWVGGYPAHYLRAFHRRIEEELGDAVRFFYAPPSAVEKVERAYEVGTLPVRSVVLDEAGPGRQSRQLIESLRQCRPSVVFLAGHFPWPVLSASLWGRWARWRMCYWSDVNLLDLRDEPAWRRAVRRKLMRLYLRDMARLLYVGAQGRAFFEWCCGGDGPPRQRLPYPHDPRPFLAGAETGQALRARHASGADLVVLCVGRLVEHKAVDRLVRAVSLLPPTEASRIRCLIAGAGPSHQGLERLASRLGVGASVRLLGAQPNDRIPSLFAAADLVIVPSRLEPWGLVVNEALSAGRPVMAPWWIGAASDLLEDGVTGLRLASNSPEVIAEGLRRALTQREALPQMGRRGRVRVAERGWTMEGALAEWRLMLAAEAGVPAPARGR
jgi:glycosyltransferase involved in cell wall biosynthesis